MADYKIFETDNFSKNLSEINHAGAKTIHSKLLGYVYPQLRKEPHFGPNIKKLKNFTPDTWRYRVGDWQFFYEIDEKEQVVYMIAAHHRQEAY